MEPFQFDYLGYMKNMVFLIILMGVLAYILVKLKTRDGVSGSNPLSLGLRNLFAPPTQRNQSGHIEVLEKKNLEPRKNIYLVRVFGEQYWLIGTTDTHIESLAQLKAPGHQPESLGQPQEQANAFADYLTQHEAS